MPVKKNMEGQKCGRLLVLELAATPPGRRGAYWLCECECGCRTVAFGGSLRNGGIKSCGCLLRETVGYGRDGKPNDMRGQRYGRLVVRRRMPHGDRGGHPMAECDCDCGGRTVAQVAQLRNNRIKSCGCLKAEFFGRPAD